MGAVGVGEGDGDMEGVGVGLWYVGSGVPCPDGVYCSVTAF